MTPVQRILNLRLLVLLSAVAAAAVLLLWCDPRSRGLIQNTLGLAAGSCAISLPWGTALAIGLVRTDLPGRRLAMAVAAGFALVAAAAIASFSRLRSRW